MLVTSRSALVLLALLLVGSVTAGSQAPGGPTFAGEQAPVPWRLSSSSGEGSVLVAVDLDQDGVDEVLLAGAAAGATTGSTGLLGLVRVRPTDRLDFAEIALPGQVRDVAVGDLDADGSVDAVAATSAGLAVLLGDGAGALVPAGLASTEALEKVALADLDGDGDLDIVGLRYLFGMLTWLGDGQGGFASTGWSSNLGWSNVAVGDWDEDGLADAVVSISSFARILRGDGQGGFTLLASESSLGKVQDLEVADFDGDGHLDIARLNLAFLEPILYGDGSGGFVEGPLLEPTFPFLPYSTRDLDAGDVDGDGLPDLLVAETGCFALLSQPSRRPGPVVPLPTGRGRACVVARLDPDARNDVLVLGGDTTSGYYLTIHHGAGEGALRNVWRPAPAVVENWLQGIAAVGDLDGDGAADLVRTSAASIEADVYLAGEDGWRLAGSHTTGKVRGLELADVDRDGALDLLARLPSPGLVSVSLGDGLGGFAPAAIQALGLPAMVGDLAIADMNGDALPDLVATAGHVLGIYPGDGLGHFGAASASAHLGFLLSVDTGDVDGNGDIDLLVAGQGSAFKLGGPWILLGDGQGGLASRIPTGMPSGFLYQQAAVLVDLDGDGRLDVASTVSSPRGPAVAVALSTGPGTFDAPQLEASLFGLPDRMVAGDLDGDGAQDLVIGVGFRGAVWLRGGGDGSLGRPVSVGSSTALVGTGDVDRDGRLDLVFQDAALIQLGL